MLWLIYFQPCAFSRRLTIEKRRDVCHYVWIRMNVGPRPEFVLAWVIRVASVVALVNKCPSPTRLLLLFLCFSALPDPSKRRLVVCGRRSANALSALGTLPANYPLATRPPTGINKIHSCRRLPFQSILRNAFIPSMNSNTCFLLLLAHYNIPILNIE